MTYTQRRQARITRRPSAEPALTFGAVVGYALALVMVAGVALAIGYGATL